MTLDFVLAFINDNDGKQKGNDKCVLGWNADMSKFDSSQGHGNCPEWFVDEIMNNGEMFIYHDYNYSTF